MIFTLSFVYTFASWLKRWQRERNPLWACWNISVFMGRQIFRINTENACKRVYLFWCILRAIYIETSGSTLETKCCLIRNLTYNLEWNALKKVCKLVQLEYMQIFPAGRHTSTWRSGCEGRGEGGEYSMICWAGVSSVTKEPLAFATPCSAAILPP